MLVSRRFSPLLPAVAVLAVLFAHAAPPASAQQEGSDTVAVVRTVLVSNFGQDPRLSDWSTNNFVVTQEFTTGTR